MRHKKNVRRRIVFNATNIGERLAARQFNTPHECTAGSYLIDIGLPRQRTGDHWAAASHRRFFPCRSLCQMTGPPREILLRHPARKRRGIGCPSRSCHRKCYPLCKPTLHSSPLRCRRFLKQERQSQKNRATRLHKGDRPRRMPALSLLRLVQMGPCTILQQFRCGHIQL